MADTFYSGVKNAKSVTPSDKSLIVPKKGETIGGAVDNAAAARGADAYQRSEAFDKYMGAGLHKRFNHYHEDD